MDDHDKEVMIKDLVTLGLDRRLLDSLSGEYVRRLFNLIGWAAPSFKREGFGDGEPTTADEFNEEYIKEEGK